VGKETLSPFQACKKEVGRWPRNSKKKQAALSKFWEDLEVRHLGTRGKRRMTICFGGMQNLSTFWEQVNEKATTQRRRRKSSRTLQAQT